MKVNNKQFWVAGFGVSGEAAARLLVMKGAAKVVVIDESKELSMKRRARRKKNAGIQFELGIKTLSRTKPDAVIMSPGIHPSRGLGQEVMELDVPTFGELELASWFCQCPVVAITGTNGKTTTTELIERMLKSNRKKTLAAGNIGLPLSEVVLKSDRLDYLTVEVSSFQLELVDRFCPKVSVMMNITPDHLDRYHSFEDYARAKGAIWKNQGKKEVAIVNVESERLLNRLGFVTPSHAIRYSIHGEPADLYFDGHQIRGSRLESLGEISLQQTRLMGRHNAENVMVALAVGLALELDLAVCWKSICGYKALPHRLESVGMIQGVEWVNDSKATNLDAMEKGVEAMNRPMVLIAGGKDKGFDFKASLPALRGKVRACVLIGEMKQKIFDCWKSELKCHMTDSLESAVKKAMEISRKGEVVLLSPGCSSYDMFESYEDRGDTFRRIVQQLSKNKI